MALKRSEATSSNRPRVRSTSSNHLNKIIDFFLVEGGPCPPTGQYIVGEEGGGCASRPRSVDVGPRMRG